MTIVNSHSLIALGHKRLKEGFGIVLDELWDLSAENRTEGIIDEFAPFYEAEVKNKRARSSEEVYDNVSLRSEDKINVLYPLFKTFGWNLFGIAFIKLVVTFLPFVAPAILSSLIAFIGSNGEWRYGDRSQCI